MRLFTSKSARLMGCCGFQEGDGAFLCLVGPYVGESDAGMVVDGDMNVFPAGSPRVFPPFSPRRLLCFARSPVMPWPTWLKRPHFLISMWIISPGLPRS